MSGEQVRNSGTTPQVFLAPLTLSDGKDVNIFLLLTFLQKGTLDFDGEYRKYAAQKQADGEFLVNLMKMLEEAVSAKGNKLKYKDVEKVIDRYFKNHDIKNMRAGQLIALFDIKNMCKGLKDKDANILDLIGKVEHDIERYNHYQHLVDDDKAKIKHALKKAKKCGKHLDTAGAAYWLGVDGYYETKLETPR